MILGYWEKESVVSKWMKIFNSFRFKLIIIWYIKYLKKIIFYLYNIQILFIFYTLSNLISILNKMIIKFLRIFLKLYRKIMNYKKKKERVFSLELKLRTFHEGNKRFARSNYRSVIPYRRDYGCWLLLVYFIAYCAAALPL